MRNCLLDKFTRYILYIYRLWNAPLCPGQTKGMFSSNTSPPLPADCMLPELTLFITAYNEEDVVDDKMRNSLSLDYPADKLHILWITDGSNDRTNERLSHWPQATVLYQPKERERPPH